MVPMHLGYYIVLKGYQRIFSLGLSLMHFQPWIVIKAFSALDCLQGIFSLGLSSMHFQP